MSYMKTQQLANRFFTEYFTHTGCDEKDIEQSLANFFSFLKEERAMLVNLRIFVTQAVFYRLKRQLEILVDPITCPVTWIAQPEKPLIPCASFVAHAISGAEIRPLLHMNQVVGCCWKDQNARYLHMNILASQTREQGHSAKDTLETMQQSLTSAGSDFSHTVRTWLFADNILAWYDQLNLERNQFYQASGIFSKLVPASTGIGVSNPFGAALTAELLAVQPLTDQVIIEKIVSPMQCEALNYKSSFSRAVLVRTPEYRKLYISGTASIGSSGNTENLNDCIKQIELTMRVVEAIICGTGMTWANSVQAIAYFKDSRDFALFDQHLEAGGIKLPHVKIEADICRHNLLFELEVSLAALAGS